MKKTFEIEGEEVTVEVYMKRITLTIKGKKPIYSCYDVKIITKLLAEEYNAEFAILMTEWIYKNSPFLDDVGKRKCDCWLENDMCCCEANLPVLEGNKTEKNDDIQLSLF